MKLSERVRSEGDEYQRAVDLGNSLMEDVATMVLAWADEIEKLEKRNEELEADTDAHPWAT